MRCHCSPIVSVGIRRPHDMTKSLRAHQDDNSENSALVSVQVPACQSKLFTIDVVMAGILALMGMSGLLRRGFQLTKTHCLP